MNLLPVVVSWADSGSVPDGYLGALHLLVRNATLVLERTAGILVGVDDAVEVRSAESAPADLPRSGIPPLDAWGAALRALRAAGYDPATRPVFAALMNGGIGGLGQRMGVPTGGALAVLGDRYLANALLPLPAPPWTVDERDRYAQVVWVAVHELGHALGGLPHNPPDDPSAPVQARRSFMNYGSAEYWRGQRQADGTYRYMATVGWSDDELRALRASPHAVPSPAEYVRLYPLDREYVGLLRPDLPAWQLLSTGLFVQEYGALPPP